MSVKVHASKITMLNPADLRGFDRNARTHPEEQIASLAAVIADSGFTNPVLIDGDNVVIAGHGRILAALRLGMERIPCIRVAGLSDAQVRALRISDNKLGLLSGWDEALLRTELGELKELGLSMDLTGFGSSELFGLFAAKAGFTDPDDAPPAPKVAVSLPDDIWILGDHRIVCGSSTDRDTVQRVLDGAKPHLMVTDPPYGVNYDPSWRTKAGVGSKGAATGAVLNDDRADWTQAWELAPCDVAYVWHGGLHAGVVQASLARVNFTVRAQIVWIKHRPALSRGHYHWQHEPALYAVREGAEDHWRFEEEHEALAYAVKDGATGSWVGGRKQSTVWNIEHVKNDTGHSTQKPVECMKRPMENNSQPGDAIYEPFSGSGSCIIAGEVSGRRVFAVELSPAYVDVACQRWAAYTQRDVVLEETGETFVEVSARRLKEAHAERQ